MSVKFQYFPRRTSSETGHLFFTFKRKFLFVKVKVWAVNYVFLRLSLDQVVPWVGFFCHTYRSPIGKNGSFRGCLAYKILLLHELEWHLFVRWTGVSRIMALKKTPQISWKHWGNGLSCFSPPLQGRVFFMPAVRVAELLCFWLNSCLLCVWIIN